MRRGAASEREAVPRWHSWHMKTFGAGFWWLGAVVAVLALVGTLLAGDTKSVA